MVHPLPPLAALRAFVAVARLGSFARAAAALNVSTSAISHQVRTLEGQLGTALVTRARNGAGLSRTAATKAGSALLDAVEEALAKLSDACDAVRAEGRPASPTLTISASGSVASLWVAPRLAVFAGRHAGATWHLRACEDEAPDLEQAAIDLAIIRVRPTAMLATDHLLFRESIFPVCSPTLLASGTAEDILLQNLLEEEHGADVEKSWAHWLPLLGRPAGKAGRTIRFGSFNQVVAGALAGTGLALGRSPLIDDELRAGRLARPFPLLSLPGSWTFVARTRPGAARNPHVARLRNFLGRGDYGGGSPSAALP
ncbi:LysR family transcriptional regulator [Stella humosa]|uniref:LysR family transcriptional regulator n=1 Tax=Stella humosa TaxID=94 RepID=A0A3N1ME59_9PROT|nr:LysR substrate-binding domain-containing protein [Stella humosa]ROQ01848.1 LysR family transcriptional regulator [Stella humosa]BBK32237.1 LysR family transcriptional regulator [Stella humosa]